MKAYNRLALKKLIGRVPAAKKLYEQEKAKVRKETTPFEKESKKGVKKVEVRYGKKSITGSNRTLAAFRETQALKAIYEVAKGDNAMAQVYDSFLV